MLTMRHHLRDRNEIPVALAHELVGEEMIAALRIYRLGAHEQQSDPSCRLGAALRVHITPPAEGSKPRLTLDVKDWVQATLQALEDGA
jgi:hypothetical protein